MFTLHSLQHLSAWHQLKRLARIKCWMRAHRSLQPFEYHPFDGVLTCWVMGWVGFLPSLVVASYGGIAACVLLVYVPQAYVQARERAHLSGRLRCDWWAEVAGKS